MAGLGFKDFQVGEVLTSSDVDGYLMQQAVMRFADAAARGSALGTAPGTAVALAEGMVSYLDDANEIQYYNGTDWLASGKIIQVKSTLRTTVFSTASTSFSDVVTVSITPTSTANEILLMAHGYGGNTAGNFLRLNFVRNSTNIVQSTSGSTGDQTMTVPLTFDPFAMVGTDAPGLTSAITYRLRAASTSGTAYVGRRSASTDYTMTTTLIAIEYVP